LPKPNSGGAPIDHLAAAAAAVRWALERVGDRGYALRCLAFVEDAFERANGIEVFGGSSAAESAERYGLRPFVAGDTPPEGSFVFYATEGPIDGIRAEWGHVGLSLGDGRVVHAWDEVRVDDARAVEQLEPAPGWTPPRLRGWTEVATVLRGHRPRRWDDA
jgi:cell wall-associated NlpC family hydrolase